MRDIGRVFKQGGILLLLRGGRVADRNWMEKGVTRLLPWSSTRREEGRPSEEGDSSRREFIRNWGVFTPTTPGESIVVQGGKRRRHPRKEDELAKFSPKKKQEGT